jgi:excinuclease ABC subunit B
MKTSSSRFRVAVPALSAVFAGGRPAEAIRQLVEGVEDGLSFQTLLGVTGSGKTFTMANVIARMGRPAIVFAPTRRWRRSCIRVPRVLPAQRGRVFRQLLRLLPARGLRAAARPVHREGLVDQRAHRADAAVGTKSLLERRDVIIVATVSAIYGIGNPSEYHQMILTLRAGDKIASATSSPA